MRDLKQEFIVACINNNIEELHSLWALKNNSISYNVDLALSYAVSKGNSATIDFLFDKGAKVTSKIINDVCQSDQLQTLKKLAPFSTHVDMNRALSWAATNDNVEMMHYLISSKDFPKNADVKNQSALECACENNSLKAVKYLLSSPLLNNHANIKGHKGIAIKSACKGNSLAVVKYLLTSEELIEHASIHVGDDEPFKLAHKHSSRDVIEYLINDYYISITKPIAHYMAQHKDIKKLFSKRLLKEKMENFLPTQQLKKAIKI